jgi:hypothetical protein
MRSGLNDTPSQSAVPVSCTQTAGFFSICDPLRMPLTPVQRPGIESPAGVHFGMTHDGTSIRGRCRQGSASALADGPVDKLSLLAKFDLYRRQFEAIASDKFDRGEKGPIKATRADVIKFVADRRPEEPSA